MKARGIPVRTISEGDGWNLGRDVTLSVLLPPATIRPGAKDNERSVVLAVESSGHKFLLTGDLEGVGLIELVSQLAPTIPRRPPRPAAAGEEGVESAPAV